VTSAVVTEAKFSASPARVWETLLFYEEIGRRPPLHLRLMLPTPVRTEGPRGSIGDETRCVYEGGHLLKRVIRIERWKHFGFEVAEQALSVGPGIRLTGGSYSLRELSDGSTRVELETRYVSPGRPAWFWRPIETAVCHAFHRHILGEMRRDAESVGSVAASTSGVARRPGKR
jgi:hypothetical protein